MRILILGAGKMGRFFTDAMCLKHEVALFDTEPSRLRFVFNTQRLSKLEEIDDFKPEICINAVTIKFTIDAFKTIIPHLPKDCILSDIASVKTGLPDFYKNCGMRFVSTHPMFGPTFANLENLSSQNAIIISESDHMGKAFFKDFYSSLKLNIFEYTFLEHDQTTAYSLSIPFASTLAFTSVMKKQEAPGTTFKKHMDIAKGLLSEDDYLLSEILFNPFTAEQIELIREKLGTLVKIVKNKDKENLMKFLTQARKNIE